MATSRPAEKPLWSLENVSLGGAQQPRLQPLTIQIQAGRTAIIGYSGAGKTSLLNLLVGFEQPSGGKLNARGDRLFWAPPDGGLWPHLTVREHFSVVRPGNIGELLERFDLTHKLDAHPDELSEGERSRLSVARALWTEAEVLVMDEPLVHVDPTRAQTCWRAIRSHLEATGASLVFSTHSPATVLGEAERAVCLKGGQMLYEGSVRELYHHPPTAELAGFLGPANWFDPAEAGFWLGCELAAPGCWRPEQLEILPAAGGALTVGSTRFLGQMTESELRQAASGATQTFYHRSVSPGLRTGQTVAIHLRT